MARYLAPVTQTGVSWLASYSAAVGQDAHSPCTACTPTRYSLMTGQLAFRAPNGGRVISGAGGPSMIAADRMTLPKMLQEQDYSTAFVGKWHPEIVSLLNSLLKQSIAAGRSRPLASDTPKQRDNPK